MGCRLESRLGNEACLYEIKNPVQAKGTRLSSRVRRDKTLESLQYHVVIDRLMLLRSRVNIHLIDLYVICPFIIYMVPQFMFMANASSLASLPQYASII